MTSKLCVIEGDYRIIQLKSLKKHDSGLSPLGKINELIDLYKAKLINEQDSASLIANDYSIIHSKDGSEICSNLIQNLSATYDFDATLINSTVINNSINNSAIEPKSQRLTSTSSSFVCFVINDFDQNDNVFLKLEETQSKICSVLNALNNTTMGSVNTTVINMNLTKRFMIFGWPVLNHCLENNLVSFNLVL